MGGDLSLGATDAPFGMVFLHGMESADRTREHREQLESLAADLGLRIGAPLAPTDCPGDPGLRCWGWPFDQDEPNLGRARAFTDHLAGRGPAVRFVTFDGGHEIQDAPLRALIARLREAP